MTVLVTGGTGVQGSWVTRRLVEVKRVKPIVFDVAPNTILLRDVEDRFETVSGDTTDFAHLARTVKKYGIKHNIHMAALTAKAEERARSTLREGKVLTQDLGGSSTTIQVAREVDAKIE